MSSDGDPHPQEHFREHEVTGAVLSLLDDMDLLSMGVRSVGHRKRILRAAAELHEQLPQRAPSSQREKQVALRECVSKVLDCSPQLPLQSKRLLLELWTAQSSVCSQALDSLQQERREHQQRHRKGETTLHHTLRKQFEEHMYAAAVSEDAACESRRALSLAEFELRRMRPQEEELHDALHELESLRSVGEMLTEARAENTHLLTMLKRQRALRSPTPKDKAVDTDTN